MSCAPGLAADLEEGSVIKLVAMLRRPFGISREEFQRWWLEEHVPKVREYPGLRKYVVSLAVPSGLGEPIFDGIAELWFDDLAAAEQAVASPEAVVGHNHALANTEIEIRLLAEEHVIR